MLSKAEQKLLQGLQRKKERRESGLFLAEGEKIIAELLEHNYPVDRIYATEEWFTATDVPVTIISEEELSRVSTLSTPNKVIAVCQQDEGSPEKISNDDWVFALDDLQDPGNLGTIIRIADWFGIKHIVCSSNTVDVYNPKVVQSTMGSFINVNIIYADLPKFLLAKKQWGIPVYGTTLHGEEITKNEKLKPGIMVFGNESVGITKQVLPLLDKQLLIAPIGSPVADSLNVAISAAIIASHISI